MKRAMRKTGKRILLLMLICLLALGCVSCTGDDPADSAGEDDSSGETGQTEDAAVSSESDARQDETDGSDLLIEPGTTEEEGEELMIGETGKVRLTYTGDRSSVQYITSVDQLPDEEALNAYDEEYFREHALLVVVETVRSGSVDTGIFTVRINEDQGTVTLYHDSPQGAAGTWDMATWLLWAEVEPGLECRWTVANPAVKSSSVSY